MEIIALIINCVLGVVNLVLLFLARREINEGKVAAQIAVVRTDLNALVAWSNDTGPNGIGSRFVRRSEFESAMKAARLEIDIELLKIKGEKPHGLDH